MSKITTLSVSLENFRSSLAIVQLESALTGDVTKLTLRRNNYLSIENKIEAAITRKEALTLAQALIEHYQFMPKEIADGLSTNLRNKPLDEGKQS